MAALSTYSMSLSALSIGQDYEAAHDAVAKQAHAARQGGAGPPGMPGGPPPYGARPPMGFPPHGPPPGYQVSQST